MNQDQFYHRRQNLLRLMETNSLAILPAAPASIRNQDTQYPYRQDSDFYYLTGFAEQEAVAVIAPNLEANYTLFCRPRDTTKESWSGPMAGIDGAIQRHGADAAFPIADLNTVLPKLLEQVQQVYYTLGCNSELDSYMVTWLNGLRKKNRTGVSVPKKLIMLDHYLHELRLIKSDKEIQNMRQAAAISAQAHILTMKSCRPCITEYELEAIFIHECMIRGAKNQAYPPIIGSGSNSCILHYEANLATTSNVDLVLIDAGCEYDYYAADITRTFPVNGRFSPAQRDIYELVLEAQIAALKKIKPGNTWEDAQQAALHTITRGLLELKILSGTSRAVAKLIREEKYKPFYMHRIGHWLGMDVHDVGAYKIDGQWREFLPGMCLTIEPGVYISPNMERVHKHWHGIGIRIEDDIVVTEYGHEVLSAAVPKRIEEIEALVGASYR